MNGWIVSAVVFGLSAMSWCPVPPGMDATGVLIIDGPYDNPIYDGPI